MSTTGKIRIGLAVLLISLILSACGPSPEEQAATAAAQTAAAASPTPLPPTLTPTPTPTSTTITTATVTQAWLRPLIFTPALTSTEDRTTQDELESTPIPENFSWLSVDGLDLIILKPDDWFYKRETVNNTEAFFITKENIDITGMFSTGVSVNIFNNVPSINDIAYGFIDDISDASTTVEIIGSFKGSNASESLTFYGIKILADFPGNPNDQVQSIEKMLSYLSIANIETSTLYIVFFECPIENWQRDWEDYGSHIMITILDTISKDYH